MKMKLRVAAGAKKFSVSQRNGEFVVRLTQQAREGKANEALIKALSAYFHIPKSRISISSGLGSKKKIVDIF